MICFVPFEMRKVVRMLAVMVSVDRCTGRPTQYGEIKIIGKEIKCHASVILKQKNQECSQINGLLVNGQTVLYSTS